MTFKQLIGVALGAATLGFAAQAAATTINFTDQAKGPNQSPIVYPGATFSSDTSIIYVGAAGQNSEICALSGGCTGTLSVAFSSPVTGLSFQTDGDNDAGANVFAQVTTTSGTFMYTGNSDGVFDTYDFHDLSSYGSVTGLSLTSSDFGGLGYDYFTFNVSAAPEPSTWTLMIAGLAIAGGALRYGRRNVQASASA